MIKDEANPLGNVIEILAVDNYIHELIKEWNDSKETIPWYKLWYKISLSRVITFLMDALDDLICYIDNVVENGADKKATVLIAIEELYDHVIKEAMPVWMKPFSGSIKSFIIYNLISNAIDWMVNKYRNGAWRMKDENKVKALWVISHTAGKIGK